MLVHVHAVEHYLRLGLLIAVHRVEIGGLARSASTQQQHHVAGFHAHVDIPKQTLLLEKLVNRTFLQVDRQPLAQHVSPAS